MDPKNSFPQNIIPERDKALLTLFCYRTNNNFAYHYDANNDTSFEAKIGNFIPTYDDWCLGCDNKDAQYKCSGCKSVRFCSKQCQKKCWKIHKNHCTRTLFVHCINCCKPTYNHEHKCPNCPVNFCSEKCKNQIYQSHLDFDCENLAKIYSQRYSVR